MLRSFGWLLTWWGAGLLAFADASPVVYMPFGADAVVIYLAARDEAFFWVYPLIATLGSVAGAVVTYWVGRKAGEAGLERLVRRDKLERLRAKARQKGAVALALPAIFPPPFPLTPFILTSGALAVDRWRFFGVFTLMRLVRFAAGAALGRVYGSSVLAVLESDAFRGVIIAFVVVAVVGTIVSATVMWRNLHRPQLPV